jgi:chemotaxis family two-component system response regulator Rcp1
MASKTARIVLVEDNPGDVLLVRKALQEKGVAADLTCFEDGPKALKSLAQQEVPDLILLDLNLPKIEGFDVLNKIRSTPKLSAVPVVILTSSESPADKQRTALLGASRYITKPSGLDDFLREVGRGVEEMLLASGWK